MKNWMPSMTKIKFSTKPYDKNRYSILLEEGKFEGVRLVIGEIDFVSDGNKCNLKYNYDILESSIDDSNKKEFDQLIGELILKIVEEGYIVIKNDGSTIKELESIDD